MSFFRYSRSRRRRTPWPLPCTTRSGVSFRACASRMAVRSSSTASSTPMPRSWSSFRAAVGAVPVKRGPRVLGALTLGSCLRRTSRRFTPTFMTPSCTTRSSPRSSRTCPVALYAGTSTLLPTRMGSPRSSRGAGAGRVFCAATRSSRSSCMTRGRALSSCARARSVRTRSTASAYSDSAFWLASASISLRRASRVSRSARTRPSSASASRRAAAVASSWARRSARSRSRPSSMRSIRPASGPSSSSARPSTSAGRPMRCAMASANDRPGCPTCRT